MSLAPQLKKIKVDPNKLYLDPNNKSEESGPGLVELLSLLRKDEEIVAIEASDSPEQIGHYRLIKELGRGGQGAQEAAAAHADPREAREGRQAGRGALAGEGEARA